VSATTSEFRATDPGVFVLAPGSRQLHTALPPFEPRLEGRTWCGRRWNDAIRPTGVPKAVLCKRCSIHNATTSQLAQNGKLGPRRPEAVPA